MSHTLFPTITGSHWRTSIARSRAEPNFVLARIRERISQQGASEAGRSHKPDSGGSTPSPATNFTAAGSAALGRSEAERRAEAVGGGSNISHQEINQPRAA